MSGALAAAVQLAAKGVPVFPCLENKRPACPRGFKDAAQDVNGAAELFRRWPGPLIGVPTGPASRFDALDLDMDAGADEWLSENCTRLPLTRSHSTRSGGYHMLFRHHPGLRNSAGKLGPGVDIRADGGYVIWWPATGLPVNRPASLENWPGWLLDELTSTPVQSANTTFTPIRPASNGSKYINAALDRACANVTNAGEGGRNDALNRAAFSLSRFISSGGLSTMEIAERLARAALDAGLDPKEIARTIESALKARQAA